MNKVGMLLDELHEAETDLAAEYRTIGEREAADQDVYYLCHTFASECDQHAERVRAIAERFEKGLSEPAGSERLHNVMAGLRHKTSELLGRRPEAGLLLLRDLRQLYLMAEEVNIHWIVLGQVAQAVRDEGLLSEVSKLHKQTLTQIKWLKTRIKEASPQVLTVAV
jgi:hypothetical protein